MAYAAIFPQNFDHYKNIINGAGGTMNPDNPIKSAKWHVLAEGDSWFHFNALRIQENLLHALMFEKSTVIVNMALSGDNIIQMINPNIPGLFNKIRAKAFKAALKYREWDFILLSACGNDLIDAFDGGYDVGDSKKVKLIKACKKPNDYSDFLNLDELDTAINSIKESFDYMVQLIKETGGSKNHKTKIIAHTYDYFTLRDVQNGHKSIRQKALEKHNVPKTYWKQITGLLNDRLRDLLLSFNDSTKYPNVLVINTMDTLTPADQD